MVATQLCGVAPDVLCSLVDEAHHCHNAALWLAKGVITDSTVMCISLLYVQRELFLLNVLSLSVMNIQGLISSR